MVFMGTGDRVNACCNNKHNLCSFAGSDIIAAVKETHSATTIVGEEDADELEKSSRGDQRQAPAADEDRGVNGGGRGTGTGKDTDQQNGCRPRDHR